MKKISVIVCSRANYGSIKSVMRNIQNHPELELQLIVGSSALLDRYGSLVESIENDGFDITSRVTFLIEGETPGTMAKSTGLGIIEISTALEHLNPDFVLTIADRFETMAATIAAAYMNIPIGHTQGGEISGTIDESTRHAVTKLAHLHFPACKEAKDRIIRMGEPKENVHLVGCPRIDLISDLQFQGTSIQSDHLFDKGVGDRFSLEEEFIIVSQHPVTTEFGEGEQQIHETMMAVKELNIPAIVLWPNADAGSADVARGIRKFREKYNGIKLHFFKNLPTQIYFSLLGKAGCIVGNSSSGIREGSFIGIPCVNIGTRQTGRQRGQNVIDVPHSRKKILKAISTQLNKGYYESEHIYGNGKSGEKIVKIISTAEVRIQKRITY